MERQELINKISLLPPDSIAKVEELVNLLADAEVPQMNRTDNLHDEIAAYAAQYGGTKFDLDPELEAAGTEHLLETVKW